VNCTRWNSTSTEAASVFASVVLPTPGTSSISTDPPARRAMIRISMLPWMTSVRFRSRAASFGWASMTVVMG
jgi:hypothetical protein